MNVSMKKGWWILGLAAFFASMPAASDESQGIGLPDAVLLVPGLWTMGAQEVCFEASGALRVENQRWRQQGNYSCFGTHCSITLMPVPNHPASANQWKLQLSRDGDELRLTGTDKLEHSVNLTKNRDFCR